MHTCIRAYVHTCIRAYMHTCIHAYMDTHIESVVYCTNAVIPGNFEVCTQPPPVVCKGKSSTRTAVQESYCPTLSNLCRAWEQMHGGNASQCIPRKV